jgi:hypothetical protein
MIAKAAFFRQQIVKSYDNSLSYYYSISAVDGAISSDKHKVGLYDLGSFNSADFISKYSDAVNVFTTKKINFNLNKVPSIYSKNLILSGNGYTNNN